MKFYFMRLKAVLFFVFFLQDSPDSVVYQAPASTAATQVRVITRDMTGKNVWDFTLLHGSSTTENGQYQCNGEIRVLRLIR